MAWGEKIISQRDAVKAFLVPNEDGEGFNIEASIEKFRNFTSQYLAKQVSEGALITECMKKVFDKFKGTRLNLFFIKNSTMNEMIKAKDELKEPAVYNVLMSRVEEYLRENTGEYGSGKMFNSTMGKGAGWQRTCDASPEDIKKMIAKQEEAAKIAATNNSSKDENKKS